MTSPVHPLRILQVVGGMNIGGVETWLMHVLRHLDRRFQMDFMVHTKDHCVYDDEIRALGARIIPCLCPQRPWSYTRNLRRLLRECGPYDVIHSHVHFFSGLVLKAAREAGVPIRVAHSHSDTSRLQREASPARRLYLRLMAHWIRRNATIGLAASGKAAAALFGPHWEADGKYRILHCGVDLAPFRNPPDTSEVRAEWNIPPKAFHIGHVGSFGPPKNHAFLVDIAKEILHREPEAHFLWVGDGPLQSAIREKVREVGLDKRVCLTGPRSDVARLVGAMDAFVFPSLWEGMPLSLVEAQAAGVPCFVSDVITTEAHVVKPLVMPLSLASSASVWAEHILTSRRMPKPVSRVEALALVERSSFNIQSSIRALEAVYGNR